MSVTGSGQTRNPFTLHLVSIITVSVATFFPYTTSMARVYYTYTKELQKFVMEITSPNNMADCRHPSDPKCGINPYYRQTIYTCTAKKGRKSFVIDRGEGDRPHSWRLVFPLRREETSWPSLLSTVWCCSVSSRFWFRSAEMLIHRDLFLFLTISPSFIRRHLCVCSKKTLSRNFLSPFS